jgi:hypothetical protein
MPVTLEDARSVQEASANYSFAFFTASDTLRALPEDVAIQFSAHTNDPTTRERIAAAQGDLGQIQSILTEAFPQNQLHPAERHTIESWSGVFQYKHILETTVSEAGGSPELFNEILLASANRQDISFGGISGSTSRADGDLVSLLGLLRDQDADGHTASSLIAAYNAANPHHALEVTAEGISAQGIGAEDTHAIFAQILGEIKDDIGALQNVNYEAIERDGVTLGELNTVVAAALEQARPAGHDR